MTDNGTYTVARTLQRAGRWDLALAQVPPGPAGAALRAEILTDRHLWRLDPPDEALAAIDAVAADRPELAALLAAQIEYWHRRAGGAPHGDDPVDTFAGLVGHPALGGWPDFWHGITREALHDDPAGAAPRYARARELAVAAGDLLLESYAVRHQAGLLLDAGDPVAALPLARRSLQLRAAVGARPHVAAAQAMLADVLGDGPEAEELRAIVALTAVELGLAWLLPAAN